jgi:hypothetical protein
MALRMRGSQFMTEFFVQQDKEEKALTTWLNKPMD